MAKIGVLSDTHGLLRPEVIQVLKGCDAILHGGDINRQEIIDELEQIAPVYVVRGNNDKSWAEYLPAYLDFTLMGLHVYMTHKKKDLPKDLGAYDLLVYGHSHRYEESIAGGTYLLNPGSCGPRRLNQAITLAIVETSYSVDELERNPAAGDHGQFETVQAHGQFETVQAHGQFEMVQAHGQLETAQDPGQPGMASDQGNTRQRRDNAGWSHDKAAPGKIRIRRIDIAHARPLALNLEKVQKHDVEKVMREIRKGRSAAQIASGFGMDPELAEQICRMYLTHPGVDAEGIMTKLGL